MFCKKNNDFLWITATRQPYGPHIGAFSFSIFMRSFGIMTILDGRSFSALFAHFILLIVTVKI